MVAAAVRRRVRWIVSLLSAACSLAPKLRVFIEAAKTVLRQ
jgi:hypothetical protein